MGHYFAEMNSQKDMSKCKSPYERSVKRKKRDSRTTIIGEIIAILRSSLTYISCDGSGDLDSQVYAIPEETIYEIEKLKVK